MFKLRNLWALLGFVLLAAAWPHAQANAAACTAGCSQVQNTTVFSGTSVSVTLTSVVAGHSVRGLVCYNGPTAMAMTVGGSSATSGGVAPSGGGYTCSVFNKINVSSGSVVVTGTATGTCVGCFLFAEEWPDTSTTGTMDGQNGTYLYVGASGTSIPTGSFTTTGSSDSIEVFLLNIAWLGAATPPSGYATSVNLSTSAGYQSAYITGVSAGSTNPAFVSTAIYTDTWALGAGFTGVTGGGGGPPLRVLMGVGK